MGKIPNGLLGAFIGSTANVTGYELNGQNVVRVKARHVTKGNLSPLQLANCQKMSVLNEFFYFLSPLLKVGYSIAALGTTKNYHNLATSYNKKNAIKGEYPNLEMDFPKVQISEGKLLGAENPAVEWVEDGLKFSWSQPSEANYKNNADQVIMFAYFPEIKEARYTRYGAQRSAGFDVLKVGSKAMNTPAETYISFISDDRTAVATSSYLGRI
jgi:hypothetical protein